MIHSLGSTDGEAAELRVARAIQQQRPHWDIVHSRWYVHDAPRRHIEGEGDLVVIIPNLGFVVIEVKGAAKFKVDQGVWYRWDPDVNCWVRYDKPPWHQAAQTMHYFRQRFKTKLRLARFGSAFAVAFPNADASFTFDAVAGEVNHDLADEDYLNYTIDGRALDHIGEELEQFLDSQAHQSRCDTSGMLPTLIPTGTGLQPYIRGLVQQAESCRVRLTDEQCAAVSGVLENPRVVIQGGPGTGKSVVALDIARRQAKQGQRCLLLCFNRMLMEDLRYQLRDVSVEVNTVHAFAIQCVKSHAAEIQAPSEQSFASDDQWLTYCTTEGLGRVLDSGLLVDRDLIIVDEYQDLSDHQSAVVRSLPAKRFVVLCDPYQNLFGEAGAGEVNLEGFCRYSLRHNIRNSRELALCIRELGPVASRRERFEVSPVVHRWPSLVRCDAGATARDSVSTALTEWKSWGIARSRTAILAASNATVNYSIGILNDLGQPTVRDIDNWRRARGVLVSTIRAFKGLDADAVALLSPPPIGAPEFEVSDAYVAVSRACIDLRLIVSGPDDPSWFAEAVESAKNSGAERH